MGIVQMNNNGSVTGGFAEPNHHMLDDQKKISDRVTREGEEHSEEYESQVNENVKNVYDGRLEAVQVHTHSQDFVQRPQLQPREPLVRWERFLPLRSLKVLLVEHDDSTRHVVNALLRNCGYEVVAVANGLQAWKILEDLTSHIDLVLTEVEPCLSGIALLYKIMSHKTRKNIPVIMMSSHDSMGIVFKCLSKGAVDFLVKPIRKNELKNLWQHIWRRCHSSSGSGSGSGIRTQKSIKSKSVGESDNNTGSNDEDGIRSIGVNARDGSDNGSGTQQSSWTKRAVEVDSPQPQSPWDQSEPQDSTCAQVIHPRPEACNNNYAPVSATKECKEQDNKLDKAVMGKDLEIGITRIPSIQLEDPGEIALTNKEGIDKGKVHEINSKEGYEHLAKGELELSSGKLTCETRAQYATNSSNPQIGSSDFGNQNGLSKISNIAIHATKEMPSLELSLKRQRDIEDAGSPANDRHVLRHSDLSAFSRYNSAAMANQTLTGNVDSCSPVDNSSETPKTGSMQNFQSNSNISPPNQRSNGSSTNCDMGSTTNNGFTKTAEFSDKQGIKSTVKNPNPSSGFLPVQDTHVAAPQAVVQGKPDTAIADIVLAQTRGVQQQVQVNHHQHHQHHHHHYHHYHHHVHKTKQQQQLANNDDTSMETMTEEAPKSGSSNMLSTPITGDVGNHSGNASATGSNCGSNGQNMSSADLNALGTTKECDNEAEMKGGVDGGIGFRIMPEQSPFTLREAALQKFRQKRKDRCFEKKVRYHSRQKLAEQRPRVRGQFVRQAMLDNNNKDKDVLS